MTIYHVQLYKILDAGKAEAKECLMKDHNVPAVFLKAETAKDVGNIVVNSLNTHMYSRWEYRLIEGETL